MKIWSQTKLGQTLLRGVWKYGAHLNLDKKLLRGVWKYGAHLSVDKDSAEYSSVSRAGNSLIGFPSKSLDFCPKMSEWAIRSKKWVIHSSAHFWWAKWAIRSRLLISSKRPEQIAHGRSFLVSEMSNSLTSLIWFERNERFTHIAHQKRGNERKWAIRSFFGFFF